MIYITLLLCTYKCDRTKVKGFTHNDIFKSGCHAEETATNIPKITVFWSI